MWEIYQEDFLWDFWLAKVNNGKSFNEFKKEVMGGETTSETVKPPDEEIRAIIESSKAVTECYIFEDIET